eukprot:scaffold417_cov388-Prasinococcus_capsulatus_cf.AAC.5
MGCPKSAPCSTAVPGDGNQKRRQHMAVRRGPAWRLGHGVRRVAQPAAGTCMCVEQSGRSVVASRRCATPRHTEARRGAARRGARAARPPPSSGASRRASLSGVGPSVHPCTVALHRRGPVGGPPPPALGPASF